MTAPTAQIGHQVLHHLVDGTEPVRVIARDPARLPAGTAGRVEVVKGSHGDRSVLDEALDGADAVFWLVPPDPTAASVEAAYVGFSRPVAEALSAHGVEHVVSVSALGRGTPQAAHAGYVTGSLAVDDLIAGAGVHLRALTMPSFMDNIARQAALIRDRGMFTSPIAGDRRMPVCATRDIATTAAGLLRDRSWSGVAEVPVLGPEDLSFDDMAEIITSVLGRPVRFQQVPAQAYRDRMTQFGMSGPMAQGMLDMALAKDAGLDNAVVRTPQNSTATSFRQWCEDVLRPAVAA